ncbi:MAG: ABC transporter [Chloroflexi bacterium 44-23]|nr:MAG: ABC transporter [Chloroflexi bacterium 44-23]
MDQFGGGDPDEIGKFNAHVIRRLLSYLIPHRWKMVAALILTLLQSGLTLLNPYLIKNAIDLHITPHIVEGLATVSLQIALVFVALFFVSYGQSYLLSWVGQNALTKIRDDLFRHLQKMQLGYHDKHITGVTVSHVINDVAEINELLSQGLVTLIGDVVVLVGIIVVMLKMSPKLALLAFTVLPLIVVSTWLFSRQAKIAFRETRSKIAAVVGDLAEDISGMRAIQAFTQEEASQKRFRAVNRENRNAYISAMSLSFVFLPAVEFLGMLATGIVLWFGGRFVINEQVTIGVLVAFLSYVSRFFQPILELSRLYTTFQSAMAGGEQVMALLDYPLEIPERENAIILGDIQGKVELRHVDFRYTPDSPIVLKDLSMLIHPGENIAIVGATGAGKTTIANIVARFYDVSAGAVLIDDIDVRDVQKTSLHRQVVVVSQTPFLFSRTIAENISYGKPQASLEEIIQVAKRANADKFIAALPDGYDTKIQEGGVNLSLGQRQLISIARAMLVEPRILILDEATANIDTITEVQIQVALERLFKGRTSIVIAHRLSTVRKADRIYVLEHGKIVEEGRHDLLIQQKGLYAALYDRQFINS